ncbi:hypothetical protein SEPCBS57363_001855 [Sporothrix epigloea]|uniref:Fe2OG dioxygenase domain-containing protein n=1 Tax=Sporothrix epigloea TaxID=1892477 RepID=A0ABP0DF72_9PEZI
MPHTLPIDLADFPAFRTRKALLIIDLQNEFLSPSGTLPVTTPDGFVNRTLDVASRFRESGSGDIFWVRSQFDAHRPAATSQIITSTTKPLSSVVGSRPNSARRRKESEPPSDDQDADPEAFLSMDPNQQHEKPGQTQRDHNLLAGSHGSEFAPPIASSVNARQDLVLTKTHYSAFHSTQLLNRLRTRFVTELYICGALTNISVYATALDAARHGLSLIIIEDCCGYRDITRHENAITSLIQLTGCETLSALHVIESMVPQPSDKASAVNDFAAAIAAITGASSGPPRARRLTKTVTAAPTAAGSGSPGATGRISGGLPVRTRNPVPSEDNKDRSKALPPSPSPSPPSFKNQTQITPASNEIPTLSLLHPAAKDLADDGPETTQSLQSLVANGTAIATEGSPAITAKVVIPPTDSSAGTSDPVTKESINNASPTAHATSSKPPLTPKTFDAQTPAPIEPREISTGRITPNEDADQDDDTDTLLRLTASPRHAKLMEYSRLRSKRNAPSLRNRLEDLAKERNATSSTQRVKQTEIVAPTVSGMQSQSVSAVNPESSRDSKAAANPTSSFSEKSPVSQYAAAPTTTNSESNSRPPSVSDAISKTKDLNIGAEDVPISTQKAPFSIGPICAGDTVIHHDVLPKSVESGIFERLQHEVQWQRMSHQGGEVPRLVCVQGEISEDGSLPVYRHPSDECPPLEAFTPTVVEIKREVEKVVGHPLNHALIQLYRTGDDYISEHSDKTLDIVPGSYVCNMSLGAERTMVFRTKRVPKDTLRQEGPSVAEGTVAGSESSNKRQIHRVQLPHNSLCCMGLQTNMKWLHAIRQDKRANRDKSPAALAYGGGRISLTFRQIGTFLNATQTLVWGQGAVAKLREDARPVVNGHSDEAIRMLRAFGAENHSSDFDWKAQYGKGFDVLHMSSSPRFFASTDAVVNMTIQLFLADLGVKYARGSISSAPAAKKDSTDLSKTDAAPVVPEASSSLDVSVRFVDNDKDRSAVQGVLAILLYLDTVHGTQPKERSAQYHFEQARKYTRLQQALHFQDRWRVLAANTSDSDALNKASASTFILQPLKGDLAVWEAYASKSGTAGVKADELSIAGGSVPSFVDFAFWSVLHSMESAAGGQDALLCELRRVGASHLSTYYAAFKGQSSVRTVLAAVGK